jgi:hypothetical protein
LFAVVRLCSNFVSYRGATTRKWGKVVLRERLAKLPDHPVSTEVQLDEAVTWVLDILGKVVKARIH